MNPPADDRPNQAKFDELIAVAQEAMGRLQVPGLAVGLAAGPETYTAGLGVTSVDNPLPVTPQTLFRIGSTTKTYTATALFQLVEQGKLSLDDPVRKLLPDFRVKDAEVSARVTVRQLLNHTSGWVGDFFLNTGDGDDALEQYVTAMADLPQLTPLGALYTYNNAAVNVAGRVIEVITGQPYEAAIRERVLLPLGLGNTFFTAGEVMLRRFALGHVTRDGRVVIADPWVENRSDAACGGLVSDVRDQLTYARFHMGDGTTPKGERLLSPKTLRLMQTPAVSAGEEQVGLNWFIQDTGGVRFVSHGGSSNGQQEDLWFAPGRQLALSVMTNLDTGNLLIDEVTAWVREHFLGVVAETPIPQPLSAEKLAEYVGEYVLAPTGDVFTFAPEDGGLSVTHTPGDYSSLAMEPPPAFPPMHCAFYTPNGWLIAGGPLSGLRGEFICDPQGKVAWLRFGGRIMARQGNVSRA